MGDLFETIADLLKSGEPIAVAIVVRVEGSAPRKPGAKMIVRRDGRIIGTMGGGDLEKRVIEEALETLKRETPQMVSFTLDVEKGKMDMMCGGKVDVYIEPVLPAPRLIVFGAGHITRRLGPLMKGMGFSVTVVEDTTDLVQQDPPGGVDEVVVMDMAEFARALAPDPRAYIVLLSRGFSRDKAVLQALLGKEFKYIGMIGSLRKIAAIENDLTKEGIPREAFTRLRAPIGLDLRAETPEEIALSIAAEIIAARRGKLNLYKKEGGG